MTELFSDIAEPDVVVLANGASPSCDALRILRDARTLVACDGAAAKASALGRSPDFVVGDGDSLSDSDRAALGDRFIHVDEQDTNDLAKSFHFSCSRFPLARTLVILGAHGLREDHFLGNVSRLPDFAEEFARTSGRPHDASIAMVTDCGRFDVVLGSRSFKTHVGEAMSVFAFRAGVKVVSEGLIWPLVDVELNALWKGTLNRADKDTVTLSTDSPVVVYRPLVSFNAPQ